MAVVYREWNVRWREFEVDRMRDGGDCEVDRMGDERIVRWM